MIESELQNNNGDFLFIDVGNSFLKMKTFQKGTWHDVLQLGHHELDKIGDFFGENPIAFAKVFISSVVEGITHQLESFFSPIPVHLLTIRDIPGESLDYETPETLGVDRYLACLGACKLANDAVVVIDSGTACTIDYMDAHSVYHGGVILPGLRIWEDGLKNHAPALPGVERGIPPVWPGKSTRTSLQWGLIGAYMDVIEAMLKRYKRKYGEYKVWLTGGDSDDISRYLEQPSIIDKNLVFEGMKALVSDRPNSKYSKT